MSKPPKLCVYCGSTGVTKEHFWGRWSIKHGTPGSGTKHTIVHWTDPLNLSGPVAKPGVLQRPGQIRSQTLKIACRSCNTGWMKRIVDDAIPILERLHYGEWKNLPQEEREKLSAWLTLFSMSYEFADKRTVSVSAGERFSLKDTCRPSRHWQIAIGGAELAEPYADLVTHRAISWLPTNRWSGNLSGQVTLLVFGRLIALVCYWEFPIYFDFGHFARSEGMHPLWPITSTSIATPFKVHDRDSFFRMVASFTAILREAPYLNE